MPELPEVETIRLGLLKSILGKKIAEIQVFSPKSFIGAKRHVIGQEIINIFRRGKLLRILLENDFELQIHLKLTGQIFFREKDELKKKTKHTRVILIFDDKSRLVFNDLRKFGWIRVAEWKKFKDDEFGIEPLAKDFTLKNLEKLILSSDSPIKTFLMDQKKIAGLGNIYTCESLFQAKINPFKISKKLTSNEIDSLYKAILNIIQRAISLKGSSMKDEMYRQVTGELGTYQTQFLVYEKEKHKCSECGEVILRVKSGGRSTYFCPNCQK